MTCTEILFGFLSGAKAASNQELAMTFEYRFDASAEALSERQRSISTIHDLGNMIQVASSAVSLLARRPSASDPSDTQTLIAGARSALDRAGVIVRQSISSANHEARILEHVNVSACLAEIGSLTRHMWDARTRLEIRTRSESLAVTCNALDLQNSVLNLILNAREAMPDGGLVVVLAAELPNDRGGTDIEIRVMDTGVGMTPETASRAFVPYFTTKSGRVGGVGLHAVKRFVEDAEGSIEIQSEPGIGTNVILRLPAATLLSAALASVFTSDCFRHSGDGHATQSFARFGSDFTQGQINAL
jgi:signal transduction histidine kinase